MKISRFDIQKLGQIKLIQRKLWEINKDTIINKQILTKNPFKLANLKTDPLGQSHIDKNH